MLNFKDWTNNLKLDKDWKPDVVFDFNKHLAKLAYVDPIKNSNGLYDPTLTLKKLKEVDLNLVHMLEFLYVCNRSKLISSQIKEPEWGALTPLLAAYDIKYEEWDKQSPHMKYFLGKGLECLLDLNKVPLEVNIIELRKEALKYKSGKKMNSIEPATSYKFNRLRIGESKILEGNIGRIKLQTWLANVQYRVPGIMILDVNNWDNVPKAVDEKVAGLDKKESKKKKMNLLDTL